MAKAANLIGQKFGMLTVIRRGKNNSGGHTMWICVCDCGNQKEKAVSTYDLKAGKVISCGCYYKLSNKGRNKSHGDSHTRLWSIWQGMIRRCRSDSKSKLNYYVRGISVCDEWKSYEKFKEWAISNGYSDNLTIDRIDNNKGYSPTNCRWATYKEQENNRRNNVIITVGGITRTVSEWSDITGIKPATLSWRAKHNWDEKDIFIHPDYSNKAKRRSET